MKYLFLLFNPETDLDIVNKHVFSTEAHPLRLLSEVEEKGKPPYSAQVNVAENDGSLDIIAGLREELRVAEQTIAAQAAQLEHWKAKMAAQAAQLEHWKAKALRQQEANNA